MRGPRRIAPLGITSSRSAATSFSDVHWLCNKRFLLGVYELVWFIWTNQGFNFLEGWLVFQGFPLLFDLNISCNAGGFSPAVPKRTCKNFGGLKNVDGVSGKAKPRCQSSPSSPIVIDDQRDHNFASRHFFDLGEPDNGARWEGDDWSCCVHFSPATTASTNHPVVPLSPGYDRQFAVIVPQD